MSKRVLVIDDEEAVRKSYILALEDTGYEVDVASSGEEGVEKFKQNKHHLVFLDLKMPGMNGVETLRALRKIDLNTPIQIQTAFFKEFLDLLNAVIKEGLKFEVLNKPVDSNQILAITKGVLEEPTIY